MVRTLSHVGGLLIYAAVAVAPLQSAPQTPGLRAAYASASALQEQGLYDLAAEAWRDLLRRAPDGDLASRARYNLGVCRFHGGAFDQAAERFASVADAKEFPDLAEAAFANLGLARLNAARTRMADPRHERKRVEAELAAAVRAFEQGNKAYPSGGQAAANQHHRGEALLLLGNPSAAIDVFRDAIRTGGDGPLMQRARVGLGSALLEAGRPAEVAAAVGPVIESAGAPLLAAEARLLRAEAALAGDRPAAAARDFAACSRVEGFVDAPYAAERAAFAHYTEGDHAVAAEAYLLVADRFAGSAVADGARLSAGKCWLLAERPKRAAPLLEQAWRSAPRADNAEAARWWSRALLTLDQPDEALAAARAALELGPQDAAPLQLIVAEALAARGDRPDASRAYEAFADAWPADPAAGRALILASRLALDAENATRARVLARRALRQPAGGGGPEKGRPEAELTDAKAALAEALLALREWGPAVTTLRELIRDAPADPRRVAWRRGLADALLETGEPEGAIAALGRLIEDHAGDPAVLRARYDRGRLLTAAGDRAAANADFHAVVGSGSDVLVPYARFALAANQHTAGEHQACVGTLGELLAAGPTELDSQARLLLARAQHALGDAAAALQALETAAGPVSDRLRLRALCLMKLGRSEAAAKAVAEFEQLVGPQDAAPRTVAELYHELGWMHRGAGGVDAAIASFAKAAIADPSGALAAESLFRVGELQSEAGRGGKAAEAFSAAAERGDPELREQALHLLGWAQRERGLHEPAAEAFRRQLRAAPSGPLAVEGRLLLAECLFAQQRYAEALAEYRPALPAAARGDQGTPGLLPTALVHAAQAAGQTGDWKQSLELLDQARPLVDVGPLADEAAYERAWALHKLGRNRQAAPEFARLAEQASGALAARAAFVRGELHFADQEHEQAVRMFFRVAYGFGGRNAPPELHTWQAESLFEAARCLEQLDRGGAARRLYAELVERFPGSPKAVLAKARLPNPTPRAAAER